MNKEEILSYVDHTQLKAFATWQDMIDLCDDAVQYKTASVCVPPSYIERIRRKYGENLKICTVIGFPLGYQVTKIKVLETKQAILDGADEVDFVINIGDVKNEDWDKVRDEIKEIRQASKGHILKVIIETCYLTEYEKIELCKIVSEYGADFIKTSTGFGTSGATLEDVELFKKHIGNDVKIKAAGGISSTEDLKSFLEAGCQRIGTSKAVGLLKNEKGEL